MTKNIVIACLMVLCIMAFVFAFYQHAEAEYQHEQALIQQEQAILQKQEAAEHLHKSAELEIELLRLLVMVDSLKQQKGIKK